MYVVVDASAEIAMRWYFALGTMLSEEFSLSTTELQGAGKAWPANYQPSAGAFGLGLLEDTTSSGYIAYDWNAGAASARPFSDTHPLRFRAGIDYGAATFFIIAPTLSNGWTILGESSKFIPISRQRMTSVILGRSTVMIRLVGAANEVVRLSAVPPRRQEVGNEAGAIVVRQFTCKLPESGQATLILPNGDCA